MRAFTPTEKLFLRDDLQARLLVTFLLDEGTFRFCDDSINCTDGVYTWIGASALGSSVEIKSGKDLAAEPVTLVCDGNRMAQFGVADPARVLRDILGYLAQQRRVDFAMGLSAINSEYLNMVIPIYAGKINSYRMVDNEVQIDNLTESEGALEITIDSLASRYNRAADRTRSHTDQQEIDPTDMFFSFTADAAVSDSQLYWGKAAPYNSAPVNYNMYGAYTRGGAPIAPGGYGPFQRSG